MSSLKYSIPAPLVPTKFSLKSPRGASLTTWVWPVKEPQALCLIVHGGGWHSGYFDDLASVLNTADIFCASYDQVNCGYSDPEPDSPGLGVMHVRNFDCLVEDVCAGVDWVQKEAGNTEAPVFLFGESFGGLQVKYWQYNVIELLGNDACFAHACVSSSYR
jgi:alpha-beta hydrolase superfamily lysophospholipase